MAELNEQLHVEGVDDDEDGGGEQNTVPKITRAELDIHFF
jgi:hypothetical protein